MSKAEQINELILHKGFAKVRVNSHFSIPSTKHMNKEDKPRMYIFMISRLLMPSSYTVYKLKE